MNKRLALEQIISGNLPDMQIDTQRRKSMLDGKQLRALFQQFNQQFFGGKLPAYSIRVVPRMTSSGESGRWNKARRLIEIHNGLSDEDAISTLLHEMAHAATNGHHGMPWKKEMIRLREAGAPFVSPDLDVDLDDWDGMRVHRRHFRGVIQDVLLDVPEITLPAAIRHFIHNEGGPATITAFLKQCPWAGKVFNEEKRAHIEAQELRARQLAMLAASRSQPEMEAAGSR